MTRRPTAVPKDHLLELMRRGDLRALDVLARTYGPRLLAVARRACAHRGDVEDAVQQALVIATQEQTNFRGDGSPVAWLSTLVARSCYRFNEKHAAQRGLADCCSEQTTTLDEGLVREVNDALMSLPRTDRLAFLLSVEGFTSVEIAERFGLTHDAVRGRLKRVRQQLRERLDLVD